MGYSWRWALTAVFVEGVLFMLMTFCNIREAIVNCIPANLKKAISAGIGFFIAFLGLQHAGLIIRDDSTLVRLSETWYRGGSAAALIGLIVTAVLLIKKVKGAILIGIFVTTLIGIPLGITTYAGGNFVPSAPYFCPFAFDEIFSSGKSAFDFLMVLSTFLFLDMFDTVGTLIGCASSSGLVREDGSIPRCKRALMSDAVGTTAGAMLGTSTVTTFVESASGVAAGGRTGLTAVTTAVLFLLSLFLKPLFASVPMVATAPALIIVGYLMLSSVADIDWSDVGESVPAFIALAWMPFTYSISDGIMFGIISYTVINALAGKAAKVHWLMYVLTVIFIAKYALM
jgi:AGZA family xanthine/uracil permease-like MFS transporter